MLLPWNTDTDSPLHHLDLNKEEPCLIVVPRSPPEDLHNLIPLLGAAAGQAWRHTIEHFLPGIMEARGGLRGLSLIVSLPPAGQFTLIIMAFSCGSNITFSIHTARIFFPLRRWNSLGIVEESSLTSHWPSSSRVAPPCPGNRWNS